MVVSASRTIVNLIGWVNPQGIVNYIFLSYWNLLLQYWSDRLEKWPIDYRSTTEGQAVGFSQCHSKTNIHRARTQ